MPNYVLRDFNRDFPDEDACLDWLWRRLYGEQIRCPSCARLGKFHRVRRRKVYECSYCGYQVSPLARTIFRGSPISLHTWFYAIFLTATAKDDLTAKMLQSKLGVTYKTAWRMLHKIRDMHPKIGGQLLKEPRQFEISPVPPRMEPRDFDRGNGDSLEAKLERVKSELRVEKKFREQLQAELHRVEAAYRDLGEGKGKYKPLKAGLQNPYEEIGKLIEEALIKKEAQYEEFEKKVEAQRARIRRLAKE